MNLNKRRVLVLFSGIILIIIAVTLFSGHQDNRRALIVTTDSLPVKLQLNDSSYNIVKSPNSISLTPGVYAYRATGVVDGKRIVLTSKVDLQDDKTTDLSLGFKLFSLQSVSNALCNASGDDKKDCLFTPEVLSVTYLENYQWGVVTINDPVVGLGLAVLQRDNEKWVVADGPGTDLRVTGYYPQSVERALEDAKQ